MLTHARRPVLVALTLLAAVLAVHATPAAAAKSCGVAVVDDWYGNGKVDKRYPLHCYSEAVASLSPELRDYMNAEEDILRALAYAKRGKNDPGAARSSNARGDVSEAPRTTPEPETQPPAKPTSQTTVAIDDVPDEGETGVPLPLILLGGLALLLLVAGGAGVVSRRLGRDTGTDES